MKDNKCKKTIFKKLYQTYIEGLKENYYYNLDRMPT